MSLSVLHQQLSNLSEKDRTLASADVCDRFAELILDPFSLSSRVSDEVSNLLRGCLLDNDPINRVYDTVDAALSLRRDPGEVESELEAAFATYCDQWAGMADRYELIHNGTALRDCARVLRYMKRLGMVTDFEAFFQETEDEFRENGSVAHPSKYVFLAKVLFISLANVGMKQDLAEELFVSVSKYRLRATESTFA